MKKYKKYSDRKKCLPVSIVRLCMGVLEREREKKKKRKLRSALPFLKGTSVIRYFTNFICKDKNRRYTSRPYSLLKNETICSTSSFHAPLFKMGGDIRSSTLRQQSFLKGQAPKTLIPTVFSFSRYFPFCKAFLKRRYIRMRWLFFCRNIFIRTQLRQKPHAVRINAEEKFFAFVGNDQQKLPIAERFRFQNFQFVRREKRFSA